MKNSLTKEEERIIKDLPLQVTIKTFVESGLVEIDPRTLRSNCNSGVVPRIVAHKSGKQWYIRPRAYMLWHHGMLGRNGASAAI